MKSELKTFDNSWYNIGAGLIKQVFWYLTNWFFFLTPFPFPSGIKVILLRVYGAKVGKGVVIKPRVNIKYPWKLKIGDYVWVGEQGWIDNLDEVVIKNNVCISQGAMLLCGNHNYKKPSFDLITEPILLEEGSWVGAQSTVCPGVTLHSHSILSVGSVATNDLEAYCVYQGVPAKKVRVRNISSQIPLVKT